MEVGKPQLCRLAKRAVIIEHRSLVVKHDSGISLGVNTEESHWRSTRARSCSPTAYVDHNDGIVWAMLLLLLAHMQAIADKGTDRGRAARHPWPAERACEVHSRARLSLFVADHFPNCLETTLILGDDKVGEVRPRGPWGRNKSD